MFRPATTPFKNALAAKIPVASYKPQLTTQYASQYTPNTFMKIPQYNNQFMYKPRRAFSSTTKEAATTTETVTKEQITATTESTTIKPSETTTPPAVDATVKADKPVNPDIIPDGEPLPPQWKNPVSVALDFAFAATFTYLGIEAYKFITDSPDVVDMFFNIASESPFLIENLGTPLKRNLIWWGTVEPDYARVDMTVCGPKGCGEVQGKAFYTTSPKTNAGSWELIFLYGALPQFDNRLTDLLPVDENEVNVMPYIPSPDDPSAAHALTGAPSLTYTSKRPSPYIEDDEEEEGDGLPIIQASAIAPARTLTKEEAQEIIDRTNINVDSNTTSVQQEQQQQEKAVNIVAEISTIHEPTQQQIPVSATEEIISSQPANVSL